MTDLRKAAEMALEALLHMCNTTKAQNDYNAKIVDKALVALEAALAQPEQEPVCDKDPHLCGFVQCQLGKVCKNTIVGQFVGGIPEVSQQRKWVGLTGLELNHIFAANVGYPERMCRAIEAKLKEKNGG